MKGRIKDFINTREGSQILTLYITGKLDYDDLKDQDLDIDIKKHREKRSLNSNNYAWLLIGKIADVLRASKDDIYLQMLKRYGQSQVISVVEKGADLFRRTVKYHEDFGESELNGKVFKHIKVFTGSSEFDTREMSIFIDGIVSEAKDLGIETMTLDEIALMNSRWST